MTQTESLAAYRANAFQDDLPLGVEQCVIERLVGGEVDVDDVVAWVGIDLKGGGVAFLFVNRCDINGGTRWL